MLNVLVPCLLLLKLVHSKDVELMTAYGNIVGSHKTTESKGNDFYAFRGIRYAEPVQRYQIGQLVLPWNGTYDARDEKSICMQLRMTSDESEDCLYLNVYIPQLPDNYTALIPVMVWIHGGSFVMESAKYENYGPDYFLDHNVIIVTINYRLGVFGFLYDDGNNIPGNLGLRDVILGLQWIKSTIKWLGGDPDNVTLFGESSGAAVVSYISTSPLVQDKGYFKRVICQSGSALNPWSLQRRPQLTYDAILIASGCKRSTTKRSFECLRSRNRLLLRAASVAVLGMVSVYNANIVNGIAFGVTIEQEHPGNAAAVTEGSYSILKRGDIPNIEFLMGINSEELSAFMSVLAPAIRVICMEYDTNRKLLVPDDMYAGDDITSTVIAPFVRKHYFNSVPIALSNHNRITSYLSDIFFNIGFRENLSLLQNRTTVYCYEFTYASDMGCRPTLFYEDKVNVGHGEDINYLFRTKRNYNKTFPDHDYVVRERMVRMWTNFAKYGNPTPFQDEVLQNTTWPTSFLGDRNVQCLNIGYDLSIMVNPKETGYHFWKGLYDSYGQLKDTY